MHIIRNDSFLEDLPFSSIQSRHMYSSDSDREEPAKVPNGHNVSSSKRGVQ